MKKPFKNKIELFNIEKGLGSRPDTNKINKKLVWCCVEEVGSSTSFRGMAAGVALSAQVTMWAKEYQKQQYATVGGVDYKIEITAGMGDELYIKLLLSQGK